MEQKTGSSRHRGEQRAGLIGRVTPDAPDSENSLPDRQPNSERYFGKFRGHHIPWALLEIRSDAIAAMTPSGFQPSGVHHDN
jgi:hypothetical protein